MNSVSEARVIPTARESACGQKPDAPRTPAGFGPVRLMLHRWSSRRALRELSDQALLDIGLSREQARQEASRPFWLG